MTCLFFGRLLFSHHNTSTLQRIGLPKHICFLQESFFDSNKQAHTCVITVYCIHTAHRRTCAVKFIYIQQWLLSDSIVFQSTRRYVILTSLVLSS